jgi:hypothetical protein
MRIRLSERGSPVAAQGAVVTTLILKRAPIGGWSMGDYDVLADGEVAGHIMKVNAGPVDAPWMWTMWPAKDRAPMHGYELTREAAVAAFTKNWRRE